MFHVPSNAICSTNLSLKKAIDDNSMYSHFLLISFSCSFDLLELMVRAAPSPAVLPRVFALGSKIFGKSPIRAALRVSM